MGMTAGAFNVKVEKNDMRVQCFSEIERFTKKFRTMCLLENGRLLELIWALEQYLLMKNRKKRPSN